MRRISAVLITHNEQEKVDQALKSLKDVCEEIVVVDSFSTDSTPEICRAYTDRFIQERWRGYREQKQFATNQATHSWVLSLDADEVLSPPLQEEILNWKYRDQDSANGYYLARKTFFMGRWIEHTTWFPDWQMRLFQKSHGRWEGGRVHESFRVAPPTARLQEAIHHYSYSSLGEYLEQLERFSTLAAQDCQERGERAQLQKLLGYPPAVFFKNYLLRQGFRDGIPGLAVSALSATSTLFKYLKLWEIQNRGPLTSQKQGDTDRCRS